MKCLMVVFLCSFVIACGSGGSRSEGIHLESSENDTAIPQLPSQPPVEDTACSVDELESLMDQTLSQTASEVDFSFTTVRDDGRSYVFNRGTSTLETHYQSASTSKLVSAVIILRLVELNYLSLTDKPQDYIDDWPIDSEDPLYNINLSHLLSFTSGLESSPLCLNVGMFNYESCVSNIAMRNAGNDIVPGKSFYYASTHLQIAGLMACKAFGGDDWQSVFTDFKTQTGLFATSTFDLPSSNNPRLAGGMHWSANEYMAFLLALKNGEILNADSMALLLTDYTADVNITYSPALDSLMEDWHYGFGLWHECESSTFNCTAGERISSPGAYGSYPFWDRRLGYVGLVARQGSLGTFTHGVAIERDVREHVERWAVCQ